RAASGRASTGPGSEPVAEAARVRPDRWWWSRVSSAATAGRKARLPAGGRLHCLAVMPRPFLDSARAGPGVFGHGGGVVLGHEEGAGQHRATSTDGIAVGDVEPQHVDRLVALDIGLLVDRPLYLALRDQIDRHRAHVEGADFGLRA